MTNGHQKRLRGDGELVPAGGVAACAPIDPVAGVVLGRAALAGLAEFPDPGPIAEPA